jgi:hypothetical protein
LEGAGTGWEGADLRTVGSRIVGAAGSSAIAVLVLAFAGCGASDEDQIRTAYGDLQSAFEARDYEELCAVTTTDAHRHIGQIGHLKSENCLRDMRRVVTMVRDAPVGSGSPRIVRLRVDGDRATAVIVAGGSRARLPFAKEDDDWKVDALYGGLPGREQRDKFTSD